MKTKIFLSSMVIMSTLALFSSCSEGVAGTEEETTELKSATATAPCILTGTIADVPIPACTITGTVTETEIAGLLFMREEEKMARDVYTYMYDKYKLPVFKNITKSENAHMSAVLRLITGFNIADNSTNNPGEYADAHIAELYNQLIEMGNLSVVDALKVGVLIEQTDIADLQKELLSVENTSVKTVYGNLLKGSEAHLKAFTWNLKVRGVVL
ncbi:MAG: hypothetical protein A2066_11095 [Bacteroidetes bacterium GWB2_41_8]|nr:MAG: hypothetical protein A2066_11095 [Bacteroidetes bacterium GWB2_41_8]